MNELADYGSNRSWTRPIAFSHQASLLNWHTCFNPCPQTGKPAFSQPHSRPQSVLWQLLSQNRGRCLHFFIEPKQRQIFTWIPSVSDLTLYCSVETVASLKQHYLLLPFHVREVYLFHLLCNPPESTVALRRAPPAPPTARVARTKAKKPVRKGSEEEEELLQPPPTIIFCARPRTVAYLVNMLKALSIRSTALHSRLTQRERLASLSLFRSAVVPVLVSTDVGARGLDIEDVAMVINWDLPNEPEEYTHRVGRTARAGKGGVAISFVTEKDESRLLRIEERIGKLHFTYFLEEHLTISNRYQALHDSHV